MPVEKLLATRKKTAFTLDVSLQTVNRMIASGDLPVVRVRGSVRIPISAIKKLVGEEKIPETA